jgi:hypothetical protein
VAEFERVGRMTIERLWSEAFLRLFELDPAALEPGSWLYKCRQWRRLRELLLELNARGVQLSLALTSPDFDDLGRARQARAYGADRGGDDKPGH